MVAVPIMVGSLNVEITQHVPSGVLNFKDGRIEGWVKLAISF
jgi:hypothetical protein